MKTKLNKTTHILAAIAILILSSTVVSHSQEILTLEQCRELALSNNERIKISGININKAERTVAATKANFLPRLSATGNYLLTTSKIQQNIGGGFLPTFVPDASGNMVPNILTAGGQPVVGADGNPVFNMYAYMPEMGIDLRLSGTYTASVMVEQPIYMGGKITSAYKMSKIGEKVAAQNHRMTTAEVLASTEEAYYLYIKASEMAQVAGKFREVVEAFLTDVTNAQEVGLKLRNDVMKVQVKLNEAELQLRKAENARRLARINLCQVIGYPLSSDIRVSETLENLPVTDIDRAAGVTSRPEYEMLDQQIRLKEEELKFNRSEFLPQVGVIGSYGYINGIRMNGNPMINKTGASALISVSIPMFHWGEGRNKVRISEYERQMAEHQLNDLSQKMELELAKCLNECDEAALEVELTINSLKQAEENLRISRDQYQAGREVLADHLEAQTSWQKAWADVVDARAKLRLSETNYKKAAGIL